MKKEKIKVTFNDLVDAFKVWNKDIETNPDGFNDYQNPDEYASRQSLTLMDYLRDKQELTARDIINKNTEQALKHKFFDAFSRDELLPLRINVAGKYATGQFKVHCISDGVIELVQIGEVTFT